MHRTNSKLSLGIFAGIIIICFVYMLAPYWLVQAPLSLVQKWYPVAGTGLYYGIHYVFPFYIISSGIVLAYLHINSLIAFLLFVAGLFNAGNNLVRYQFFPFCTQNVLAERKFTITLFYKLLSAIYFLGFVSLIWQVQLVTENGLIPYKEFVKETWTHEGLSAVYTYPSVFWLSQSNWFIRLVLYGAAVLSAISVFTRVRAVIYFTLWFLYLSIVNFGRDMFTFPWDLFLLEIGFLAALAACFIKHNYLPRLLLFAMLFLFFRQWFSMGIVKLLWGDSSWYDLTFLKHYWLNQPSPTAIAIFTDKLPMFVQKCMTASALLFEMLIPLLVLFGRRARIAAFLLSVALSVFIELNGNFGFFNAITAVLGLWCIDDRFLQKSRQSIPSGVTAFNAVSRSVIYIVTGIIIGLNALYTVLLFNGERQLYPMPIINYYFTNRSAENKVFPVNLIFESGKAFSRFRIVSPQGVFNRVSKERKLVQVQAKINGTFYPLSIKKGQNITDPHFIAPFMNYLPFKFYYWANYVEFSLFIRIHPNTAYLSNWKVNLLKGVFKGNREIAQLIDTPVQGKVEQIRIYRYRMKVNDTYLPFNVYSQDNTLLDSIYINPGDSIDLSVFDNVSQHTAHIKRYK